MVTPEENLELVAIRRRLLDGWHPAQYGVHADLFDRLNQSWEELIWSVRGQAWTSVVVMAGKIAEGVLKYALITRGTAEADVRRKSLGSLLRMADGVGALNPPGMTSSSAGLRQHSRRLRNLAAHFSLSGDVSEMDATQAIATLISFIDGIMHRPVSFGLTNKRAGLINISDRWDRMKPRSLVAALQNLIYSGNEISFITSDLRAFFEHVVKYGSSRTLARLIAFCRKNNIDLGELPSVIEEQFLYILMNVSWSSERGLRDAASAIAGLGCRQHARILSAMISVDIETLLWMLKSRNPHNAARQIGQVARANNFLFREALQEIPPKRYLDLAEAAWAGYTPGDNAFVGNRIIFFMKFPVDIRKRLLITAPEGSLEAWALAGVPNHALTTLWLSYTLSIRANNGAITRLRILSSLESIIRTAAPNRIANFPFLMAEAFHIPRSAYFSRLLNAMLLERALHIVEEEHYGEHSAIRLLVDIIQYEQGPLAAQSAIRHILEDTVGACSMYDQSVLFGIWDILYSEVSPGLPPVLLGPSSDRAVLRQWLSEASPVEAALAVVGSCSEDPQLLDALPRALIEKAQEAYQMPARSSFLERLLDRLRSLETLCEVPSRLPAAPSHTAPAQLGITLED
jgi:hypothetical protein